MAGRRYSAGAIFLQVVPVFANVQKAIEDEAKNIDRALGDSMEKSGQRAGERAGKAASEGIEKELAKNDGVFQKHFERQIKDANKALDGLDTSRMTAKMSAEVEKIRAEFKRLENLKIKGDVDFSRADEKLSILDARLRALRDGVKIHARADVDAALRSIEKVRAAADDLRDPIEIEVRAETRQAERAMSVFETKVKKSLAGVSRSLEGVANRDLNNLKRKIDELNGSEIGIDISAGRFRTEIDRIEAEVHRLSAEEIDIDAKVGIFQAMAELKALQTAINAVDGDDINIDVNVDRDGSGERGLRRLIASGDDAANTFRSFNVVMLAVAGIGPALIPILGGIAAGLLAIGPAAGVAGAGLGSVLVGFSGIKDVYTALSNQQNQMAKNFQTSGNRERTTANAVANARRSAAKAVESALKRQQDAQESYAKSIQDVKDAEEALRQAREAAKGTGKDIQQKIKENQLGIDQGVIDVFDAQVNFNNVMSDGSSTNKEKEQARIDLEKAKLALEELRDEQKKLAAEKKKWDKEGVNGTDAVKSAQDNLNNAIDRQKAAYENLRDAAKAVDEARADGARQVAQAMQGQAAAMEQVNAQQFALNNAMANLGPAGQHFALFLFGLRKGFYRFRNDIQRVMLPAVEQAMKAFLGSESANILRDALINLGAAFGRFSIALSKSLQGTEWMGFFKMLRDIGPQISKAYGKAFIQFLEAMASIMTTLAPFALQFANGFAALMTQFNDWAQSPAGKGAITGFMDHMAKIAPQLLDALGSLFLAFSNLLIALEPYSEVILGIVTGFLNWIAAMDPKVLGAFVSAILALVTASQIAYGIASLLLSGTALLASQITVAIFAVSALALGFVFLYTHSEKFRALMDGPLGKALLVIAGLATGVFLAFKAWAAITFIIALVKDAVLTARIAMLLFNAAILANPLTWIAAAIIAVVVALVILYKKNATFRKFVLATWAAIKSAFKSAWEDYIQPALKAFGEFMSWLWKSVLKPALSGLWSLIKAVASVIAWAWTNVIWPVLKAYAKVFWAVWSTVIKVALVLMLALFKAVFVGIRWAYNHTLGPLFHLIGKVFKWLWKNVIKPILGWIADKWADMSKSIKDKWHKYGQPIFDWIGEKVLPKLKSAFSHTIDAIKSIWDGLKKAVGTPIKFVIETIINKGLIAGFNKVANWVGMDGFDPIPIPKWMANYATGGILPGYTPGRDVHSFVSPTGGRLNLSGGEAIMRPEWTAVVGPGFVNFMNEAARNGGVNSVRRAMSAYFGGDAGVNSTGRPNAFANGGILSIDQISRGQKFVRDHDYATYLMGAVGPDRFDCSGLISATTNVLRGIDNVYQRLGATGNFPWSGFKAGTGQFTVGSTPNYGGSGVGHMAGTLGGINIESRGGDGVVYGAKARGWNDPGFTQHYYLGASTGTKLPGGGKVAKGGGIGFPNWLVAIAKNPLHYVTDLVNKPIEVMRDTLGKSDLVNMMAKAPFAVTKGVAHELFNILPGPLKAVARGAGKAIDLTVDGATTVVHGIGDAAGAVGDALGFADGGILPYNGTMKYDAGGYLPPGLTSVVNLTGKPEPVFTADQFDGMNTGGGNTLVQHYEPHFEGSDLTAEDVAGDMNFQFKRLNRRGKYEPVN